METDANWWIPSGDTVYPTNATTNFYLPSGIRDILGTESKVYFDTYNFLTIRVEDALGNRIETEYDYRTLQPQLITDPNDNQAAVAFDELGVVIKSAVMGKAGSGEGDSLSHPTAEMRYNFFNWKDNQLPNYIHTKVREEHHSYTTANGLAVSWIESYEYSDGGGAVIMSKMQTKDGMANSWTGTTVTQIDTSSLPTKRWIGNGRTVLDNKGNPIKQYEPYFSDTHEYEDEAALVQVGVSPILYYDAAGRNVKTVLPNKTFVKTEFDAWQSQEYDTNDTVLESEWYQDLLATHAAVLNSTTEPTDSELRAAWLTKKHANTPSTSYLDCLGRPIYAEVTDGIQVASMYTQTDLAGRFSRIYDEIATEQLLLAGNFSIARNTSSYSANNVLGQGIYTNTAAKGESWQFTDALGRLLYGWDHPDDVQYTKRVRAEYDILHRPLKSYIKQGTASEICVGKTIYGDDPSLPSGSFDPKALNLIGQAYQSFDQSGLMTTAEIDFKGNPLRMHR